MSQGRQILDLVPLTVFISAVSGEFKSSRDDLAKLLMDYGAGRVHVQRDHPTSLSDGSKIAEAIEQSDLIICLIGYEYGLTYPSNIASANGLCRSWTQWEYDHAREVVRAHPEKRLLPFMSREAPPGLLDQRQIEFRERIRAAERATGGLFFHRYTGPSTLLGSIKETLEDPAGGLAAIQYSYWLRIKEAWRGHTVDKWRAEIPLAYDSVTDKSSPADVAARRILMDADRAPFIETRSFSILNPKGGRQLEFLHSAAFVTGLDPSLGLDARAHADWRPVSYGTAAAPVPSRSDGQMIVDALCQPLDARVVLGSVELPNPIRLFAISGSGIGKTATLAWIEAMLNGLQTGENDAAAGPRRLAIRMLAGDLVNVAAAQLIETLSNHMVRQTVARSEAWHERAVCVGLKRDAEAAGLVLLVDGLDHIQNTPRFLTEIQASASPRDAWAGCPIVLAGRPQALRAWIDQPGPIGGMAASYWRFIEPNGFTTDEAEVYLGRSDGLSRFEAVEEQLPKLISIPRILEYVRTLHADQLRTVRTAADIYYEAVRRLVFTAMKTPLARVFGSDWKAYEHLDEPPPEQIERMVMLLSALGFISLCPTVDATEPLDSYEFTMRLDLRRKERLCQRIARATSAAAPKLDELERDLKAVGAMSSVVSNGILEDLPQDTGSLTSIMWANRSIQQFFAALWLARYADGAEAVRDILEGGAPQASLEANFDAQRMRHYVFFPEADMTELSWDVDGCPSLVRTDTTYEFNLFLAEMPRSAIHPERWAAAASAWYDPTLFRQEAGHLRIWSTEMLYRSWPTMSRLGGRSFDDWWDTPYDRLVKHPPGRSRQPISPHQDRAGVDPEWLARLVLGRFFGEFEARLHDSETGTIAREMIAAEQWISVPSDADFVMGTSADASQGCCTQKVDAYWKAELLDPVQLRRRTPKEAAETGTWPEWFAPGEVGRLGREFDMKWLKDVLEPLAAEGAARDLSLADRHSPIYLQALDEIEARFKTSDETPKENPQSVRAFEMHRLPVLHRWFGLFAPGHKRVVAAYLGGLSDLLKAEAYRRVDAIPTHPPDDNPVIYTSWYDAWAFCQWATWRDSTSGKRYGLRLPHEPEWESAARWTTDGDRPLRSPREWRWWWGNAFYQNEDSPDLEMPVDPRAYADGRPGKTRAPAQADPNGLGFHDIVGNVWEWNANLYSEQKERVTMYASKFTLRYSRHDPVKRPPVNVQRVMRGGLWYYLNILATCANRFRYVCNDRDPKIGFRVVREVRPER